MSKNTNFTSANGIGSIYGARVTDNIFLRGGRAVSGMLAGVFTLDLRQSSVNAYRDVGFRCAR